MMEKTLPKIVPNDTSTDRAYILPLLAQRMKYWSTPKRAARLTTQVVVDASGQTGMYYDDEREPMLGSKLVRDPTFQDRVVAETRALLARIQSKAPAALVGR